MPYVCFNNNKTSYFAESESAMDKHPKIDACVGHRGRQPGGWLRILHLWNLPANLLEGSAQVRHHSGKCVWLSWMVGFSYNWSRRPDNNTRTIDVCQIVNINFESLPFGIGRSKAALYSKPLPEGQLPFWQLWSLIKAYKMRNITKNIYMYFIKKYNFQ